VRLSKLGLSLRCASCLAIPFVAVWVSPYVAASRPVPNPVSWTWPHLGLFAVALGLLIAPILLQRPLLQGREAMRERGLEVDQVLLLVAVGGAAAASMIPVIVMSLGGDARKFVLPWAAACCTCEAIWLWRLRRVL
jgi:hypothetical protein